MADESNDKTSKMSFLNEKPQARSAEVSVQKPWRILITDDETDVHTATTFALRNTKILGRKLEFLSANSSREAIDVLKANDDIAVIILDVVMETPNAGLDLVPVIRDQLGIHDSRIILRTGQPNQAPEIEVIRDYDINDYKLKSELTQSKLYAALTTAVRCYQQIKTIETGKKSLEMIVRSISELLTREGLDEFAQAVIVHLSGLLGVEPDGLICVRRRVDESEGEAEIIAAAGPYCDLIQQPLQVLSETKVRDLIGRCFEQKQTIYEGDGAAFYLGSSRRGDMSCYVANASATNESDQRLLELFCINISACADNLATIERLRGS